MDSHINTRLKRSRRFRRAYRKAKGSRLYKKIYAILDLAYNSAGALEEAMMHPDPFLSKICNPTDSWGGAYIPVPYFDKN